MKSLVIAGRRLPVDPLLETLGLLLADDYFGVGIMVQAQDEFAAEIVAQIADALHADDVQAVGAEEADRAVVRVRPCSRKQTPRCHRRDAGARFCFR